MAAVISLLAPHRAFSDPEYWTWRTWLIKNQLLQQARQQLFRIGRRNCYTDSALPRGRVPEHRQSPQPPWPQRKLRKECRHFAQPLLLQRRTRRHFSVVFTNCSLGIFLFLKSIIFLFSQYPNSHCIFMPIQLDQICTISMRQSQGKLMSGDTSKPKRHKIKT